MKVSGYNIKPKAHLRDANLRYADLRGAALRDANLIDANLRDANLRYADLRYADLRDANLSDANLRRADLSDANLIDANLRDADLRGANLSGADLRGANLSGADLRDANLSGAKGLGSLTVVPQEGDVIGWKKCCGGVIVKLLIPADSKRSNSTARKCRAEYVKVLEVIGSVVGLSIWDTSIEYRTGEVVRCHKWDPDRWNECSGGIHFFIDRQEAEEYR